MNEIMKENFTRLTQKMHTPILEIAKAYRTSYCQATLQKALKIAIVCIGLILCLVAIITNSTTVMTVAFIFLSLWVVISFISNIRFRKIAKGNCSVEYYDIQERIAEIIGIPEELQKFNGNIDEHSFTVYQTKNGDFLIVSRISSRLFPIGIITDRACKAYVLKQLELDDDRPSIDFLLDLNAETLRGYEFTLKFVNNNGIEAVQPVTNQEIDPDSYYGIDWVKLTIIDR